MSVFSALICDHIPCIFDGGCKLFSGLYFFEEIPFSWKDALDGSCVYGETLISTEEGLDV